jgi:RNA polymerase sigma-70 factor (ECF subfamily)
MKQRELAELFERFRAHGDAEALGEAFDRTAVELRGLARHLARNRDDADDLVQATYLTAIEKAHLLAPGREPMPWLVSILTLHARNLRRKRGRTVDPAELRRREPTPPDVELERREFAEHVQRAIDDLPAHYSAVLAPYLGEQGDTRSISRATKHSQGTVRMQLHRGLQLLRRSLARAAPLSAWFDARQLAELRREVLERAATARDGSTAFTRTSATSLAGVKLALLALLAALTATAGWWLTRGMAPAAAAVAGAAPASVGATANAATSTTLEGETRSAPIATASQRTQTSPAAATALRAGVRGRLLHSDGSPAAGVEVRLVAVQPDWLAPDDFLGADDEVQLERSRCVTGSEGEFVLSGARRGELLVLAIDCAGPLGALRRIDGAPDAAGELRVGDVHLAATVEVRGRVIDESGAPLANTRIRALPRLPNFEAAFGADAFAMQRKGEWFLSELPRSIRASLEELPTPTTRSGSDGGFTVRVAGPLASLHFQSPDREPRTLAAIEVTSTSVELGDVTLATARTVRGQVVDSTGAPLCGVEVLVGVDSGTARSSPALTRCSPTDTAGRFELGGVGAQGKVLVAARRASALAWTIAEFASADELELVLPAPLSLQLSLRDSRGAPLEDVDVRLAANAMRSTRSLRFARAATIDRRLGDGERIDDLAPGDYTLVASKPGYAPRRVEIALNESNRQVSVELAHARVHTVLVRDGARGAPLEGARVVATGQPSGDVLARGTTDSGGLAVLALAADFDAAKAVVVVSHPEFAARTGLTLGASDAPQEIALTAGGAIALQVLERGAPASARFTLTLVQPVHSPFPLQAATDSAGRALVSQLTPQLWRYELTSAWSAVDGWTTFLGDGPPLEVLREGSVLVVEGEATELVIELDSSYSGGAPGKARLRGQFQLIGVDPARVAVEANFRGEPFQHMERSLDDRGRFDFGWIPAGRYYLELKYGKGSMAEIAGSAWTLLTTLEAGEERVLEVEIKRTAVSVTVVDEAGERVAGASFWIEDSRRRRLNSFLDTSDDAGAIEALVHAPGSYAAVAEHPTLGYVRTGFEVANGMSETAVECRLERGRRVAGFVRAPAEMLRENAPGDRSLSLTFLKQQAPEAPRRSSRVAVDASGRGAFSIVGLTPGTYRLHLSASNSLRAEPLDIVVGDADMVDLDLQFALKTGE